MAHHHPTPMAQGVVPYLGIFFMYLQVLDCMMEDYWPGGVKVLRFLEEVTRH